MAINYAVFPLNPSFNSSRFTPNLKQRFWWWVHLGIDDCSELKWVFGGPRMFFWGHFLASRNAQWEIGRPKVPRSDFSKTKFIIWSPSFLLAFWFKSLNFEEKKLVFFDSGRVNFGAKDLQLLLDFAQNIHSFKRVFSQLFIDMHVYFVLIELSPWKSIEGGRKNERSWENIAWEFSGKSRKNNLEKTKQFLEEQLVGQSPRSAQK